VMLRARIAAAEQAGRTGPALARARELLATAAERVTQAASAVAIQWADAKDRSLADAVRVEILEALAGLE